jgi:hypothetical protein
MAVTLANDSGVPSAAEQLYADPTGYGKQLLMGLLKGMGKNVVGTAGNIGDAAVRSNPVGAVANMLRPNPVSRGLAPAQEALSTPSGTPGSDTAAIGEFLGPPMTKAAKMTGAVGAMFGGVPMMDAGRRALYEKLLSGNAPREEIWKQVQAWLPQWEKADKRIGKTANTPYVHLPTEGSTVNIPRTEMTGQMQDFLQSPELAKSPGFMQQNVQLYKAGPNEGGWRQRGAGNIGVNLASGFGMTPENTLLHEGQHGLQEASGHVGGGGHDVAQEILTGSMGDLQSHLKALQQAADLRSMAEKTGMVSKQAVERGAGQVFNPQQVVPAFRTLQRTSPSETAVKLAQRAVNDPERLNQHITDVQGRINLLQATPHDTYESIGGEMGARLGPKYFGKSLAEVKQMFPWLELDRPESVGFNPELYKGIKDIGFTGR